MRKRNTLNYSTVRSVFGEEADSVGDSYFKVGGPQGTTMLHFPTSIMFRMYRIGQAYGIRQLRYLESGVKIIIGQVEMSAFVKDLYRLLDLINDEVLHHYVNLLIAEINRHGAPSAVHVAVATGDYFEPRP